MVACGSSGDLSQSDFEAVITDSRIGTEVGAVVARNYAACLYRATGGEVSEIVDHVDDEAYQPNGTDADALAACSDDRRLTDSATDRRSRRSNQRRSPSSAISAR